jgi:GDPmannose 4,6-dehydratase
MKVIVTGVSGQDGAWLSKSLLDDGHEVYGFVRRGSLPKTARTDYLGVSTSVKFYQVELTEFTNVFDAIRTINPDIIYNLAAQSFVADSFKFPHLTNTINYDGYLNILESVRILGLDCRIYQASTSEMFGTTDECILDERSPLVPRSPYAVSKVAAHNIGQNYREAYGMAISNGILFNHESELRGREFVTRKVTLQLAEVKHGKRDCVYLGNLDSTRDWGYARDYVEAMRLMTESGVPDDFVVATNKVHTIRDLVARAGEFYGFNIMFEGEGLDEIAIDKNTGRKLVSVDERYFRPSDVTYLQGDYSKIKATYGWEPETSFETMIDLMCKVDFDRVSAKTFVF